MAAADNGSRLGLAALHIFQRWSARRIPPFALSPPPHLAHWAGRYSDPAVWASLFGIQHDEKDVFRVVGREGLQDWGDGEPQRLLRELDEAVSALSGALLTLRVQPAAAALGAVAYAEARRELLQARELLLKYVGASRTEASRAEAKAVKCRTKLAKLPASDKQRDRLAKQLAFLLDMRLRWTTWPLRWHDSPRCRRGWRRRRSSTRASASLRLRAREDTRMLRARERASRVMYGFTPARVLVGGHGGVCVASGGVRACALGTVGGADGDAVSRLSAGVAS